MVIEQMKLAAMPIVKQTSIKQIPEKSFGICGRQFSIFAKSILDKYIQVLNYQFDYASLVFLEQVAGMGERQQDQKQIITVTWKLLLFLLKNQTEEKQYFYKSPLLLKQIIESIEKNLLEIKSRDIEVYREMDKCCKLYQEEMKKTISENRRTREKNALKHSSNNVLQTEKYFMNVQQTIDYIEKQIKVYKERQLVRELIGKGRKEQKQSLIPFIMSRSFLFI